MTELPPLETGWLPTTPIGDTYLRRFLLNWASACAATAQSFGGASAETPAVHLADSRVPVVFSNCATLMQPLTAASAPATLAAIDAFFGFEDPSRMGEVLLVSAWPTGDLRPNGWQLMGHPPLHLLPHGGNPPPSPMGLDIDEVRDRAGLQRVGASGHRRLPTRSARGRTARFDPSTTRGSMIRGAGSGLGGQAIVPSPPRRSGPSTASTTSPWSPPSPPHAAAATARASPGTRPWPMRPYRRCFFPPTMAGQSTSEWAFSRCNA